MYLTVFCIYLYIILFKVSDTFLNAISNTLLMMYLFIIHKYSWLLFFNDYYVGTILQQRDKISFLYYTCYRKTRLYSCVCRINILEEVIGGGGGGGAAASGLRGLKKKTIIFHRSRVNSVWRKGFCIVVPDKTICYRIPQRKTIVV